MKSKVSVTIGIPTYDRLHYLREAVASALAQTYPNIEILISQNPHRDRHIREEIAGILPRRCCPRFKNPL